MLLLMGLGGHAAEWGAPFLSRLRAHYRVVTMDHRGIGESETNAESWTLEDMASDALAVLDAIGCERACVAGTSMGGMIAQLVALQHPARVERLALMATSFGGAEVTPPTEAAAVIFSVLPKASVADLQRRSLRVLMAPGFAEAHPELIEELAALRGRNRTRARVFQAQFNALLASDRSQSVRELRVPTLVVHGEEDGLIPVDNGRRLAERIPAAKLVLLPHCGHFPHLEKPDVLADALHRFFG